MGVKQAKAIVENRKNYKKNKILCIIREKTNISRFDIKKITSYSMTTVLAITEELLNEGWIIQEESFEGKVGRKPLWVNLNPSGGYFVGIEFNSFKMSCVLLDFNLNVVHENEITLPSNIQATQILDTLFKLLDDCYTFNFSSKILGIGIGVPGYFNVENGEIIEYYYIRGWKNIQLKTIIEKKYKVPCYIESNVTVMAVGYKAKYIPQTTTSKDYLFVSIRNGVRVVPIINNELFLSNKGYAGQLGHLRMPRSDRLCSCGKRGCLNAEISNSGIKFKLMESVAMGKMKELNERIGFSQDDLTVENLVNAAMDGDKDSIQFIEEVAHYLGYALGITVDILAPDYIVINGSLAGAGSIFINAVHKAIGNNSLADNYQKLVISAPHLEKTIGSYGAAIIVCEKEFACIKEDV